MATFDEGEITDLAEILGTNSDVLGLHLDFYAGVITDSDKTRVLELVTEWQAIGTDGMTESIEPKEANFGVRSGSGSSAASIKNRIAALLQFQSVATSSGLVRA